MNEAPIVAAEPQTFVPIHRENVERMEHLTFQMEPDETGYYTWDALCRQYPRTLRCVNRYFGRTGWNSDRGHVYYRELYPNEVCIPA